MVFAFTAQDYAEGGHYVGSRAQRSARQSAFSFNASAAGIEGGEKGDAEPGKKAGLPDIEGLER